MSFLDVMTAYFRGEKAEALALILPFGLLLVMLGGVALWIERSGFTWGAVVPAILFGLVLIPTGIGVGGRTAKQVETLHAEFERAPAAMVRAELPRMYKVQRNFRATYVAFGIATIVGLILVYGLRTGWAQGVGASLILVGALGLLIDGFASRRAVPYIAALEEIAQQHEVSRSP